MKCPECGGETEIRREYYANVVIYCTRCGWHD